MIRTVYPSSPQGTIVAPASKSHVQRLIAAALLAHGTTVIRHFSSCDDSDAALQIVQAFGAKVTQQNDTITIESKGLHMPTRALDCHESGLCARMFSPIVALCNSSVVINGSGSLHNRSMQSLIIALQQCGVSVAHENSHLPLIITGPLQPPIATLNASESSQFITGLLMALPCLNKDSFPSLHNPVSVPYLQLTEEVLRTFGVSISRDNNYSYTIPGNQVYKPVEIHAEGDWSGAAFPLAMGALCGTVTVTGLNVFSTQADRKIIDILTNIGAAVEFSNDSVTVSLNHITAFSCDLTDAPDLFPVMAAMAAHCDGETKIKGVHRLRGKESDRATVLVQEFAKLGVAITVDNDTMYIVGGRVHGGVIDSHNDHRIAMATAVLAIKAEGAITVTQAECVNKSYPRFWEDCKRIGIEVENNIL